MFLYGLLKVYTQLKSFKVCFGPGDGYIQKCDVMNMGGNCKFAGLPKQGMMPGNCSAEVPVNNGSPVNPIACISPPTEFICFNEGHVIDPTSCQRYYFCRKETSPPFAIKATSYSCPPGWMYNKVAKSCNLLYSNLFCKTVTCNRADNVLKAYSHSLQYWTMCIESNGKPFIIAGGCPDFAEVDLTSRVLPPKCTYKCLLLGFFRHSQNPSKYFHCYVSGLTLVARELTCAPGLTFRENIILGPLFSKCQA